MVDRDLVAEERAAAARQAVRPGLPPGGGRRPGMDVGTKRLALIAGGIGALLVAMVGGWSLLGHRPAGIPLIAPPPGPVRVKPTDAGGMQLSAGEVAQTNGPAAQALAPGPEAPAPQALQAEVEAARKAAAPPAMAAAAPEAPAVSAPVGAAPLDPASPRLAAAPEGSPAAAAVGAPATTPPSEAATGAAAPVEPAPAETVPAAPTPPPAAGGHAVQLAALDSEQAAHTEWARLARQAPALLGDRTPVILHVSRNGRQFYRLRTGGFASAAAAAAFCARARALGIACTVADF